MAIDLIGDVVRDIKRMHNSAEFQEKVVKYAAREHADKMLWLTSQGKDPSGRRYTALSRAYKDKKKKMGEPGIPNLRLGRKSAKTMNTLYIDARSKDSARIGFMKDESLPEKKRYMYKHHVGEGRLPRRKVWPTEGSIKVGSSKSVVGAVGKRLLEFFKQPRIIKGTVRG